MNFLSLIVKLFTSTNILKELYEFEKKFNFFERFNKKYFVLNAIDRK